MSKDTFDRVTAIASHQPAMNPARHVRYSEPNDPASWDAPKLDGLEFANHAEAKKAEVLFNRLISERDQLTARVAELEDALREVRAGLLAAINANEPEKG